jgi:FkbM family methyltransferase
MGFVEFRRRLRLFIHSAIYGDTFSIHGLKVVIPKEAGLELRYEVMRRRYENVEAAAVRKYLSRGISVLELGGSLGIVSKVIREQMGADATHVILEANPNIVSICQKNAVSQIGNGKTEVINAALAYGAEQVGFRFGHNANVGRVEKETNNELISVRAVSLSSLVSLLPPNSPFNLVCDIEGAELDMFVNEHDVFSRLQIGIVEIHPDIFELSGSSAVDFYEILKKRNIKIIEELGNVLVISGSA